MEKTNGIKQITGGGTLEVKIRGSRWLSNQLLRCEMMIL